MKRMTPDELKAKRLSLNLSQGELAKALGVSVNTVARWERGEMNIHPLLSRAILTVRPKLEKR